jgi:hypothetical protein
MNENTLPNQNGNTAPRMHVCKNCGFMSTRGELFKVVEGLLLCIACIDQYTELLQYIKPTKPV